jgi:long-chain acyl-CoA synthetase
VPAASYTDRPWLARYRPGTPSALTAEFTDALSMFLAAVERAPDRPLVHYFDRTLTVRDVDRMTDALAAGFVELGLRPGDRVAVYLQNVPQFVLAMLATWKAGGIMVSINPMNKARELEYLLADSGATILVTLESLYEDPASEVVSGKGGGGAVQVRSVVTTSEIDLLDPGHLPHLLAGSAKRRPDGTVDLLELIARHDGEAPPRPQFTPDDVAFLTYTSGTTGPPKGAMNTHANVVFNSQAYREWMSLGADVVVLGVAPLFHITGLIAAVYVWRVVAMARVLG